MQLSGQLMSSGNKQQQNQSNNKAAENKSKSKAQIKIKAQRTIISHGSDGTAGT